MKPLEVFIRSRPLSVIIWKIKCKLLKSRIRNYDDWLNLFDNRDGVEIGGPSGVFEADGYLPIYKVAKRIDSINFSTDNLWSSNLKEIGGPFNNRIGRQYVLDATDLGEINNNSYEFVLSSNNLEHIANPLKALWEWKRILSKNGILLLVLPKKESNFDNNRSTTLISHIKLDYENNIDEHDLTHLDEILKFHNQKRDPLSGDRTSFTKRCKENFKWRAMHHHVYDIGLLKDLMNEIGMDVLLTFSSPTDHFIAAKKIE